MKIYHLENNSYEGHDNYYAFVIVANSEKEAVEIAKNNSANEGRDAWAKANEVGEYTAEGKQSFVLAESFNAG